MLSWKVGDGFSIKLAIDPVIEMEYHYVLLDDLREYLTDYGLTALHHIWNMGEGTIMKAYWIFAKDLDLGGGWKIEWDCYIKGLTQGGIMLSDHMDKLL